MLANVVAAVANNRATPAATSGNRLGSITLGCGGQAILTTGGRPSGSINSIVSWSWLT
jgi:hypothetical protein